MRGKQDEILCFQAAYIVQKMLVVVHFVYSRRIEKVLRRWLALPYYLYCLWLAALYYIFTSATI
ncbi:hypothetical protein [Wielerella bovis]|uniref:hypothetical protein n=1 Tax=Wielerella bovis TaxID=2917790 RepID=UPI00201987A3|nr:hypothetical protein [Wielerella bovis]ULJ60314.1 hypothetical protein MIS44_11875 [Wielerella bovis]